MRLSSTTADVWPLNLQDYGSNVRPRHRDPQPHALPRRGSGALVFGAGTVQWSWGLDSTSRSTRERRPTRDMQQATVNLLADMGVQPDQPAAELVIGNHDHRSHAPDVDDRLPPAGPPTPMVASGDPVTISGTASDNEGTLAERRGLGRRRRDMGGGDRLGELDLQLDADGQRQRHDQEPRLRRQRQRPDPASRRR